MPEVIGGAVVRVVNLRAARGRGIETAEQADPLRVGALVDERVPVTSIHRHEQVGLEVSAVELAGTVLAAVVAGALQLRDGALVGPFADVPAAQTARRHRGHIVQPLLFEAVPQDDFPHRGTADVAGAYHHDVQGIVRMSKCHGPESTFQRGG